MKRRFVVTVLLLATLALGVVWWNGRRHAPARIGTATPTTSTPEMSARSATHARPLAPRERSEARAKRDVLRAEIARVLESLPPPSAPTDPKTAPNPTQPPKVYPPGNLRDRIGGRDALIKYLNQDFMPLAHECIERAQEQSPSLKGVLALSTETISDEQLGAVVDVVEAAPNNEVANAELLECIRETAYSLRLPPPPTTGREKFLLTLPISPAADMGPAQ